MNKYFKEEYLSLKTLTGGSKFENEEKKFNKYLSMLPRKLYKYQSFQDYTFEMLENKYQFLAPARTLDDPFDCLTSWDVKAISPDLSGTVTESMFSYIIEIVGKHCSLSKTLVNKLKRALDGSIVNGEIDKEILEKNLTALDFIENKDKHVLFNVLTNFDKSFETVFLSDEFKSQFGILCNSKNSTGICSLTTKKDNKPMWSLYGKNYEGFCIEYVVPKTDDVIQQLFPVLYEKKQDCNIIKVTVKFVIEALIRFISHGEMPTNLNCLNALLCTKDKDWEFQDEWRLIGNPENKVKTLIQMKVYLGCNVEKENEEKMIECAKNNLFSLYKMDKPNGNMKISYKRIG